ncbi:MAG: tRNA lysidine(34) synthetase TilS [Bacilli bacterium]|nr:tRNA lysidine(34) synthetase TilS [Bacilli bacterium]
MNKSYDYLKNILNDNDYVIIALSGGPDSMALCDLLIKLRKEININIVCAHVNHGLRIESDDEKVFVEEYCNKNNIIFEYMKIESYSNGFNEKDARNKRYKFFDKLIDKYNCKYLLTAHHGDDLIETILMRIGRGSNLKGYSGFSIMSDRHNYKLVKPLIYYTKDEIMGYIEKNNIPYVIDNSNLKDEYTRNRYRHNILPFLKKEDKNVHIKYIKYSEMLLEYNRYVEDVVKNTIKRIYVNNNLNIIEYLKLDKLIQKRVLDNILYSIYGDDITFISDKHTDEINKLLTSKKPNIKIKLPNNIVLIKQYDTLSFDVNNTNCINYCKELVNNLKINNKEFIFVNNEESDSNYVCRLNSSDIKMPLYVRNRKNGDRIEIKNLNGSKKVKDVFIDEKISKDKRDGIPIVVDSAEKIVWIPGVKKSKYNKEKDEKYDIIIKYV